MLMAPESTEQSDEVLLRGKCKSQFACPEIGFRKCSTFDPCLQSSPAPSCSSLHNLLRLSHASKKISRENLTTDLYNRRISA
jgi:hypothetical protein